MARITLFLTKSVEENASIHFEKSKKLKKKIRGAEEAIERTREKLANAEQKKETIEKQIKEETEKDKEKKEIKREWYEKFRWFISSEGFLCVGGRDSTSNDIIVKKHIDDGDLVFHTDMPGSPFFIIKAEGKEIGSKTKEEAAQATASYSRSWGRMLGTASVYAVGKEQVKKELGLPKGTFMIYGKREYFDPELKIAVGVTKEGKAMGGPVSAVEKHCKDYVVIVQGDEKKSETAKKIRAKIKCDLDEITRALPSGGCKIAKGF